MTLRSKSKITYITRFLLTAMLLIVASVAAAQDTNTFPGSGNAGVGTTTFDAGTSGIQIRPASRSKFGVLVTDTDGSRAGGLYVDSDGFGQLYLYDSGGTVRVHIAASSQDHTYFNSGGNVGIGTSSPNQKLSVAGTGVFYNSTPVTPSGVRGLFMGNFSAGSSIWSYNYTNGQGDDLSITAQNINLNTYVGATSTNRLYISNAGNIGIGTGSPGNYKLNVSGPLFGTSTFTSYVADGLYGATALPSRISTHNFNGGFLFGYEDLGLGDYSPRLGLQQTYDATSSPSITTTKASIGLVRNGNITIKGGASHTEFFRIDNSGNVGIGTSSPGAKLEVDGSGLLRVTEGSRIVPTAGAGLELSADASGSYVGAYNRSTSAYRRLYFYGSPYVFEGGNIGIGTASPGSLLQIANAAQPTFTVETTGTTGKGRLTAAVPDWLGITQNARFDGTNWNLDNTSVPGWLLKLDSRGYADIFEIARFSPGTNPRTYTPLFTIDSGGDVGIGTNTSNVAYKLDVNGAINATALNVNGSPVNGSQWANGSGNINFTGGNVGIGTTNPASNLQIGTQTSAASASPTVLSLGGSYSSVAGTNLKLKLYDDGVAANTYGIGVSEGSMDFSVSSSAGYKWYSGSANKMTLTSNGDLSVSGNIAAKYQDLAEWVPSSEHLSAGTVVVLDTTKTNQVVSSITAYDTRVAGVISAQPGITLGESGEGKVLVATTGRVRVKVDASRGPIQIGDLLVTSDVSGVAMKSEPVEFAGRKMHMPGTIIGKALEPLAKGSGEILVLLSLQ